MRARTCHTDRLQLSFDSKYCTYIHEEFGPPLTPVYIGLTAGYEDFYVKWYIKVCLLGVKIWKNGVEQRGMFSFPSIQLFLNKFYLGLSVKSPAGK